MNAKLLVVPLMLGLSGCVGYGVPIGGGYDTYPGDAYGSSGNRYPGSYPDYGAGSRGTFRCESQDGRTRECASGGGNVRLVRQLSDAPCVQGRTWGYGRGGVWVSQGCRAEFASSGGYPSGGDGDYGGGYGGSSGATVRCESNDNRTRRCAIGGGGARLVRQISDTRCVEGRNWGYDGGSVWVSGGCRGEFMADRGSGWSRPGTDYGRTIRCESQDERTRRCSASVRSDVRLVRQLSDTRCIEGRNWGWDRSGVWVSQGCRAEFSVR
jgi:hypothetical protein